MAQPIAIMLSFLIVTAMSPIFVSSSSSSSSPLPLPTLLWLGLIAAVWLCAVAPPASLFPSSSLVVPPPPPFPSTSNDTSNPSILLLLRRRRQLLASEYNDDALQRFQAEPPGFRRHPSYYADTYIRKAGHQTMTMDQKMALATQWKAWTLVDEQRDNRPDEAFYAQYPHRDVPWAAFPDTAWQKDDTYLPQFLDQGLALVERAMEAILTEYGYGSDRDQRPFSERMAMLGQSEPQGKNRPTTGGYAVGNSYDGLVRRILHAIVTQDSFHLAMAGHSAAAGHGNHFQQSYTHAYGVIMEPIFARLGVFATARNFGFGGLGTLQTGMATAALCGDDVDILVWDSGMTESGSAIGVLAVQAMLGGHKAPFFFTDAQHGFEYVKALKEGADVDGGVAGTGVSFTPVANTLEELQQLPFAAQFLECGPDLINTVCKGNQYRGMCWIDRSNFEFAGMDLSYVPGTAQNAEPGGRAGWHPGDRAHQRTGRALAGFVLHGIRDALLLWKNSTNLELKDEDWHVGHYYQNIREKLTTSFKETATQYCIDAQVPARLCQVPMQARTEFTPRYNAASTSIRSIVKATNSPMVAARAAPYDPPEMDNPNLHPPPGSLDVLAVVEGGVSFTPTLGHARRRDSLAPIKYSSGQGGSSVDPNIQPGKGWFLYAPFGSDMCDGEYHSWCKREGDLNCLLTGHNDDRGQLVFDSLSGWGIFQLSNLREGLIVIKYHDWLPSNYNIATNGWCNIDNIPPCPGESRALAKEQIRQLKAPPPEYCETFLFEFAIDGKITTWNKDEFVAHLVPAQRVVQISTLLDDPDYTGGETRDVELAIRMSGCGRQKVFGLTHIYWA